MSIPRRKTWRWPVALVAVIALASGCGGGGSDSSNGSNSSNGDATDDPDGTDTSGNTTNEPAAVKTVSGVVEAPSGVDLAQLDLGDRVWAALGGLIGPTQAAVEGLEVKPNVQVSVVRLNSDGTVAETLKTGMTDSNGEFSLDVDVEATGDLVVLAGGSSESIRAPAGGENVSVNPVSESIVRKIVDRVQGGDSTFDDYTATELSALVRIILDELEAAGVSFTDATSIDDAVGTADGADTSADELVADAEGDTAIPFSGGQNVARVGVELEAGPGYGTWSVEGGALGAEVTAGPAINIGGRTEEVFNTKIEWVFREGPALDNVIFEHTSGTETIPETAPDIDISVGTSGRLLVADGGRGGVSGDGQRFAFSGTDDNSYASIVLGAAEWSPGSVDETFNMVRFNPYVDRSSGSSEFFRNTVGGSMTQRFTMAVSCASGSCDVTSTPADQARAVFAQAGPEGFRDFSNQAGAGDPNIVDFGITVSLGDDGKLAADQSNGDATRGFIAPDASMLVLHFEVEATNSSFPGHSTYVGVPQGGSCDASTLNGTYNVAGMGMDAFDSGATDQFDGELGTETIGVKATFDGAGQLTLPASSFANADLRFGSAPDPTLVRDRGSDSETTESYTVNDDCTVEIQFGGAAEPDGSSSTSSITGAVSPDGETLVLGDYYASNLENAGEMFQQLLVGFREPAE